MDCVNVDKSQIIYNLFNIINNFFGYVFRDQQKEQKNKEYIHKLIRRNNVEYPVTALALSLKYEEHPYLEEISNKTNKIKNAHPNYFPFFINYISNNMTLLEQKTIDKINILVNNIEPLSYPVTLFHGFQNNVKYNIHSQMKNGDIINIKGFACKTLSFCSASKLTNFYQSKFLVVEYPIGSKHLYPNFKMLNEEYEYITHSDEQFVIIDIKQIYILPRCLTFYICKPYA
jgi:hypothetical protein